MKITWKSLLISGLIVLMMGGGTGYYIAYKKYVSFNQHADVVPTDLPQSHVIIPKPTQTQANKCATQKIKIDATQKEDKIAMRAYTDCQETIQNYKIKCPQAILKNEFTFFIPINVLIAGTRLEPFAGLGVGYMRHYSFLFGWQVGIGFDLSYSQGLYKNKLLQCNLRAACYF